MRLILLGEQHGELPEMPPEVTEVWTAFPTSLALLDWSLDSGVPVTLVAKHPAEVGEEVLDRVADVIKSDNPQTLLIDTATPKDVVLLSWDDSDDGHQVLENLTDRGITVQDMNDDFQQLVIQNPLEELMKAMAESITREVLKTVRAEIREQLAARPRRARAVRE
jgi:hypothetical protein